jgi:ABC-2 type transport system ATP-binding protein
MKALHVRDVSKRYRSRAGAVDAVRHVSLDVEQGAVLALLGENGAGKSTLMRLCAGLLVPDSGEVRAGADEGDSRSTSQRSPGCLLEGSRNLYWRLTPLENLEYFGGLKGLRRRPARVRAIQLLERFGLGAKRSAPVQTLSRGQQQRLSVLCSLIHEPRILLLDEPTLGLDHESSSLILQVIREITAEGVAVIVTSHQIDLMQAIATDVVILRRGELVLSGPVSALLNEREGIFEVQVDARFDAFQEAQLIAEFPSLRVSGTRITVDDRHHTLHLVLARLRRGSLVSVTRGAWTLDEVFRRTVFGTMGLSGNEARHA